MLRIDMSGRFAVNVIDSLIVVHHQTSKVNRRHTSPIKERQTSLTKLHCIFCRNCRLQSHMFTVVARDDGQSVQQISMVSVFMLPDVDAVCLCVASRRCCVFVCCQTSMLCVCVLTDVDAVCLCVARRRCCSTSRWAGSWTMASPTITRSSRLFPSSHSTCRDRRRVGAAHPQLKLNSASAQPQLSLSSASAQSQLSLSSVSIHPQFSLRSASVQPQYSLSSVSVQSRFS